ncbi:YqaJ viral recombinase family protein [Burkholderia metallica]|uniref:YqaJ viral recombinase family protein n=1 Tax=Burkholderia metallica TaxID=488729 RepID=UPI001CF11B35|nr:YqaJ viral recombinase family protein [Burkholderia metallica]MCA8017775.1 YqaJ viral recombinase family protein [Burkholderia metallica]
MHNLAQGSDEWMQFRLTRFGASEAAAMLGLSPKVRRTELLHMKHTGNPKEFSDWVQANILDYGHEVEALARPIAEELIGDDLYPVTCSLGMLSASCDGLTMDEETAFEHKQWNDALAASMTDGVLPDEHQPQAQQILLVTGAKRLIFVCSNGTHERFVSLEVTPDSAWFDRIRAGWQQFAKDLAEYVPQSIEVSPIGRTPETLPALRIELTGEVVASNLAEFKRCALAVFAGINRDLKTDQDFADAAKTVTWCEDVESRLAAAKQHALSQTQTIDALFNTIDEISAEARAVRLELDKLVAKRKTEIKDSALMERRQKFTEHVAALDAELKIVRLDVAMPDFAAAAKNKRTVATLYDALDTALAAGKIEADSAARDLRTKLEWYRPHGEAHGFLFRDLQALIQKPAEDFELAVTTRIEQHKRSEAEKTAAQAAPSEPAPRTVAPATSPVTQERSSVPAASHRVAPSTGAPTLRLGQINERLAPIALTADGLATLGISHAATDKAAKLYYEEDFPRICNALVQHILAVMEVDA